VSSFLKELPEGGDDLKKSPGLTATPFKKGATSQGC